MLISLIYYYSSFMSKQKNQEDGLSIQKAQ